MNTLGLTRQRQLDQTEEVKRSFKATTSLALGLTKQRVSVKHEMLQIDHGHGQLEELKILKEQNKGVKKESREIQVAKADKGTVKGVGFNMQGFSSEKGRQFK